MTQPAPFTNRLAHETSPYLRQHQHNPVDWFPWGPEALGLAREQDKPIFLSVGYSACHWCHVMEHESFENEEIARILNEHFISIKVDREERPDIDQIYMTAVQMLSGQGGWPMSVFLTPDLRPFTGGTYFPPDDRYGRPGFRRLLLALAEAWKQQREQIVEVSGQLTEQLQRLGQIARIAGEGEAGSSGKAALKESLFRKAVSDLGRNFDAVYGGFGSAPKFPHPMDLRLLLRIHKRNGDEHALNMVQRTLENMAMGGIYDHLGGGFARYSTDARWLVPHFEKMLYDNALLACTYLEAYQVSREKSFRSVAEETLNWVLREMTSPEGPFYSTLDADSEGVEGKFYVWTKEEIEQVLGTEEAELFHAVYGVEAEGNWDDPHERHLPVRQPKNILHRTKTFAQYARLHGMDEQTLRARLDQSRQRLYEVRSKRVWPGLDDKILTSWNALMIQAQALASQVLEEPRYVEAASRAAGFLLERMRNERGLLYRTYSKGGEPKLNAYLEDYAYLIDALVTLYEATFEVRWLNGAVELADVLVDQFWDTQDGGFFYTGKDHETLIARNKDAHDNAIPSGNAMAVCGLLRLAKLTGRSDLYERAEKTLQLHQDLMAEHPRAVGQMLVGLDFYLGPVEEFAIVGDPANEETRRVLQLLRAFFRPNKVVALQSTTGPSAEASVPLLAGKTAQEKVTTFICRDFACQEPLVGADALEQALKQAE